MKKLLSILVLLASIIAMSSCINDEEDTEFDLISPTDSTGVSSANTTDKFKFN